MGGNSILHTMNFLNYVREAVDVFKKDKDNKPIRVISNIDSDGITAASILVSSFKRENISCVVTIVKQLTEPFLNSLSKEDYSTYFFLDVGAGYLNIICKKLNKRRIFVLDHHYPDTFASSGACFIHLNPHLHNIDGTKEISAAGISYFFSKELNSKNKDLAYLAIIGAIGDMQEHKGFMGLNSEILKDAVENKSIQVKKDLRFFGAHTKPIYKVLEYSTNPYIPGVTGNEKGAIQFLKDAGINPKNGSNFRWISDLSKKDLEFLLAKISQYKYGEAMDTNIIGSVYLVNKENKTFPTHDAVEFSTLLNACGKMGNPSLGVAVCIGDSKLKEKAFLLLIQYHNEIIECLNWFYRQKNSGKVIEKESYVIINAENFVRDGLIGTLTSMLSKSNIYPEGTILIGLANMLSDEVKISCRVCGFKDSGLDLRKIVKDVIKKTGGNGGGHRLAAGAVIPQEKEQLFLKYCMQILDRALIEEKV